MTRGKLDKVLENHKHWINEDCAGWENMRANLYGANLRGANLYGADLREANLYGADLRGANLYGANLRGANLRGADLREEYLYGADLRGANLYGADLREANLYGADLRGANLYGADLRGANLRGADLREAYLYGADLRGANLRGAKNVPYIPMACPEEGSFIGWKKSKDGLVVKLEIPEDALRSSATGRKCRCNKAKVLAIYNADGTESDAKETHSYYDTGFTYKIGETVEVKDFNTDRWDECSDGIHFFINRREAVEYEF